MMMPNNAGMNTLCQPQQPTSIMTTTPGMNDANIANTPISNCQTRAQNQTPFSLAAATGANWLTGGPTSLQALYGGLNLCGLGMFDICLPTILHGRINNL